MARYNPRLYPLPEIKVEVPFRQMQGRIAEVLKDLKQDRKHGGEFLYLSDMANQPSRDEAVFTFYFTDHRTAVMFKMTYL